MSEIKKGDIVMLKSGGPVMTVQNVGDLARTTGIEDGVLCVWFDGNRPQQMVFEKDSLEIYEE